MEEGNMFPTAANETINILREYKEKKNLKMEEETIKYLDELLLKYDDKYFMLEDE